MRDNNVSCLLSREMVSDLGVLLPVDPDTLRNLHWMATPLALSQNLHPGC